MKRKEGLVQLPESSKDQLRFIESTVSRGDPGGVVALLRNPINRTQLLSNKESAQRLWTVFSEAMAGYKAELSKTTKDSRYEEYWIPLAAVYGLIKDTYPDIKLAGDEEELADR